MYTQLKVDGKTEHEIRVIHYSYDRCKHLTPPISLHAIITLTRSEDEPVLNGLVMKVISSKSIPSIKKHDIIKLENNTYNDKWSLPDEIDDDIYWEDYVVEIWPFVTDVTKNILKKKH